MYLVSAMWKTLINACRVRAGGKRLMKRLRLDGNPLVFLFARTWHYSAGNRAKVALFWFMFIIAELISLIFQPLILAEIMNVVQKDGITRDSLRTLLMLLACLLLIEALFWALH